MSDWIDDELNADDMDSFYDLEVCPRCKGDGEVPCRCGGDMCVCPNQGEAICPTCHGEGEVTHDRAERYFENLRQQREWLADALSREAP